MIKRFDQESNSSDDQVRSETHSLFERPSDEQYQEEWAAALKNEDLRLNEEEVISLVVFRLESSWFALHSKCFKEVMEIKKIHCLPHQKQPSVLGIVNLNGELQPCISFNTILQIDTTPSQSTSKHTRMLAIGDETRLWVFPVDEIDGIYRWKMSQVENVPINVSKSTMNYLTGIIKDHDRSIGIIDEELLFYYLRRIFS